MTNMTKLRRCTALAAVTLLALAGCGLSPSTSGVPEANPGSITPIEGAEKTHVTVGGKSFTEQLILGKIAVYVAKASGFKVTDMTSIPGSQPARKLMISGQTQVSWDYTGSAWLTYMNHEKGIPDQRKQWEAVRDEDRGNGLVWGNPTPFNNTYAFATRTEFAKAKGITKLSDIAKLPPQERTMCVESEFNSRTDGLNPLLATYGLPRDTPNGIPQANISLMDTGTIYTATDKGSCNFGEVFTTDGRIDALDLTVLEDDRHFFPSYNAAPIFNAKLLKRFPQLEGRFDMVAKELTETEMRKLNYQVDVKGRDPGDVVYEWMLMITFITQNGGGARSVAPVGRGARPLSRLAPGPVGLSESPLDRRLQARPNHSAISFSAFSGESEAWMRFSMLPCPHSRARSPRIEPGTACVGLVAPARARTPSTTFLPLKIPATSGPRVMYSTMSGKNGLSATCA